MPEIKNQPNSDKLEAYAQQIAEKNYRKSLDFEAKAYDALMHSRESIIEVLKGADYPRSIAANMLARLEAQGLESTKLRIGHLIEAPKLAKLFRDKEGLDKASKAVFEAGFNLSVLKPEAKRTEIDQASGKLGKIRSELFSIATRLNPNLHVSFVHELYGEGAGLLASGLASTEKAEVAGMFEVFKNLATVSLSPRFNAFDTMYHEAWHSLEAVLSPIEKEALLKAFPANSKFSHEERTAVAFADWALKRQKLEEMDIEGDIRNVRKSFRTAKVIAGRAKQLLEAEGLHNAEDVHEVFESAFKGDLGRRIVEGQIGKRFADWKSARKQHLLRTVAPVVERSSEFAVSFKAQTETFGTIDDRFDPVLAERINPADYLALYSDKTFGDVGREEALEFLRDQYDLPAMFPPHIEDVEEFARYGYSGEDAYPDGNIPADAMGKAASELADQGIFDWEKFIDVLGQEFASLEEDFRNSEIEKALSGSYVIHDSSRRGYFLIVHDNKFIDIWGPEGGESEWLGQTSDYLDAITQVDLHERTGSTVYDDRQGQKIINEVGPSVWHRRPVQTSGGATYLLTYGPFALLPGEQPGSVQLMHLASGARTGKTIARLTDARQLAEKLTSNMDVNLITSHDKDQVSLRLADILDKAVQEVRQQVSEAARLRLAKNRKPPSGLFFSSGWVPHSLADPMTFNELKVRDIDQATKLTDDMFSHTMVTCEDYNDMGDMDLANDMAFGIYYCNHNTVGPEATAIRDRLVADMEQELLGSYIQSRFPYEIKEQPASLEDLTEEQRRVLHFNALAKVYGGGEFQKEIQSLPAFGELPEEEQPDMLCEDDVYWELSSSSYHDLKAEEAANNMDGGKFLFSTNDDYLGYIAADGRYAALLHRESNYGAEGVYLIEDTYVTDKGDLQNLEKRFDLLKQRLENGISNHLVTGRARTVDMPVNDLAQTQTWARRHFLEVNTGQYGSKQVRGSIVKGDFGIISNVVGEAGDRKYALALVHLGTGRVLKNGIMHLDAAKRLASALSDKLDWSSITPASYKEARDVIDATVEQTELELRKSRSRSGKSAYAARRQPHSGVFFKTGLGLYPEGLDEALPSFGEDRYDNISDLTDLGFDIYELESDLFSDWLSDGSYEADALSKYAEELGQNACISILEQNFGYEELQEIRENELSDYRLRGLREDAENDVLTSYGIEIPEGYDFDDLEDIQNDLEYEDILKGHDFDDIRDEVDELYEEKLRDEVDESLYESLKNCGPYRWNDVCGAFLEHAYEEIYERAREEIDKDMYEELWANKYFVPTSNNEYFLVFDQEADGSLNLEKAYLYGNGRYGYLESLTWYTESEDRSVIEQAEEAIKDHILFGKSFWDNERLDVVNEPGPDNLFQERKDLTLTRGRGLTSHNKGLVYQDFAITLNSGGYRTRPYVQMYHMGTGRPIGSKLTSIQAAKDIAIRIAPLLPWRDITAKNFLQVASLFEKASNDAISKVQEEGHKEHRGKQKARYAELRAKAKKPNTAIFFSTGMGDRPLGFYSPLIKTIESMPQRSMDKGQFINWLYKQPRIKEDELKWTRIKSWVNPQSTIHKDALLTYLKEQQVRLNESVLTLDPTDGPDRDTILENVFGITSHDGSTMGKLSPDSREYYAQSDYNFDHLKRYSGVPFIRVYEYRDTGRKTYRAWSADGSTPMFEETADIIQIEAQIVDYVRGELGEAIQSDGSAIFEEYSLPGGDNYREILLKLPVRVPNSIPEKNDVVVVTTYRSRASDQRNIEFYDSKGDLLGARSGFYGTDDEAIEAFQNKQQERRTEEASRRINYYSGHFPGHKNIVVHMRVKDRYGPDGNKILYIEEIQSDWHQDGRRLGYRSKQNLTENAVANGPFQKTWHDLAIKRAIQMVAEDGDYAGIGWTAGEVQAERYGQLQTVNALVYIRDAKGNYDISFVDTSPTIALKGVQAEDLKELVGLVVSEKMINDDAMYRGGILGQNGFYYLDDFEINIGGEGMAAFYDKHILNSVNKIGKPYGVKATPFRVDLDGNKYDGHSGTTVTRGTYVKALELIKAEQSHSDHREEYSPAIQQVESVLSKLDEGYLISDLSFNELMGPARTFIDQAIDGESAPSYYMPVPMDMKLDILRNGQPMFKVVDHDGIPEGYHLHQSTIRDSYKGELFGSKFITDNAGIVRAGMDFSLLDDEIHVQWVEVSEGHRGQGLANALFEGVKTEYPEVKLTTSMPISEGGEHLAQKYGAPDTRAFKTLASKTSEFKEPWQLAIPPISKFEERAYHYLPTELKDKLNETVENLHKHMKDMGFDPAGRRLDRDLTKPSGHVHAEFKKLKSLHGGLLGATHRLVKGEYARQRGFKNYKEGRLDVDLANFHEALSKAQAMLGNRDYQIGYNGLSGAINKALTNNVSWNSMTSFSKWAEETVGNEKPVRHQDTYSQREAWYKFLEERLEEGVNRYLRDQLKALPDNTSKLNFTREFERRIPSRKSRTTNSIRLQSYSTPPSLAVAAGLLVGMDDKKTVHEPAAGHGILTLLGDLNKIRVNEIDSDRQAGLRRQGFTQVGESDARYFYQYDRNGDISRDYGAYDIVIMNPPFGADMTISGQPSGLEFPLSEGLKTRRNDFAVAAAQLQTMKEDGKAVLILGAPHTFGKKASDGLPEDRSLPYRKGAFRNFYYHLYKNYNVQSHWTLDGKLYADQGASWPVELIVIDGKGKSNLDLPGVTAPKHITSYEQLIEEVNHELDKQRSISRNKSIRASDGWPSSLGLRGTNSGRKNQKAGFGSLSQSSGTEAGRNGRTGIDGRGEESERDGPNGLERNGNIQSGNASGQTKSIDGSTLASNRLREGHSEAPHIKSSVERSAANPRGDVSTSRGDVAYNRYAEGVGGVDPDTGRNDNDDRSGSGRRGAATGPDSASQSQAVSSLDLTSSDVEDGEQSISGVPKMAEIAPKNSLTQVPYNPRSKVSAIGTVMPRNMAVQIKAAFDRIEDKVGDIDTYVAKGLGYDIPEGKTATEVLSDYFAAEQIDTIALQLDAESRGLATITAHQAGVGKGRIAAAQIKRGMHTGTLPIFCTERPDLYPVMVRDLNDIGVSDPKIFVTNDGLTGSRSLPLPGGGSISTPSKAKHDTNMEEALASKEIDADIIMTTPSQLQTVRGNETLRRKFIKGFAPGSRIILDESHNFGGQVELFKNAGQPDNRSDFIKNLQKTTAIPPSYLSATWAKRADVMGVYHRTSLGMLGMDPDEVGAVIDRGGVPLMQAVSAQLAENGEYFRLEKNYDGISFNTKLLPVDESSYDRAATIMSAIQSFDDYKHHLLGGSLGKSLAANSQSGTTDSAIGKAGVDSINFTSLMHNIMKQLNFAAKADAIADQAIEDLGRSKQHGVLIEWLENQDYLDGKASEVASKIYTKIPEDLRKIAEQSDLLGNPKTWKFEEELHVKGWLDSLGDGQVTKDEILKVVGDRKPVIALETTAGAFLEEYSSENDILPGDMMSATFGDILKRYLVRSRDVTVGNVFGEKQRSPLTDEQLGDVGIAKFQHAMDLIEKSDFADLPISPIDYVKAKIEGAGYTVGEITGRTSRVDYSEGTPLYRRRGASETSKAAALNTRDAFNAGELDAILINKSAASGIDLHASEKFSDQRQRHMYIWQGHADVNVFEQINGRVNRTGQTVRPVYSHMVGDVPAEIRPAAVLSKNLAQLNANTSANRKHGVAARLQSLDFMNSIGDMVIARMMADDRELHARLAHPLKPANKGDGFEIEGAAKKVSGRLGLISVADQKRFYDLLDEEYNTELKRSADLGFTPLEANFYDLEAEPLRQAVYVQPDNAAGAFGEASYAYEMQVKRPKGAPTWQNVMDELKINLSSDGVHRMQLLQAGKKHTDQLITELDGLFADWKKAELNKTDEKKRASKEKRLNNDLEYVKLLLRAFRPAENVAIDTPDGRIYGTITNVTRRGKTVNPAAKGDWLIKVAVAGKPGRLELPLSQIDISGKDSSALQVRKMNYTLPEAGQKQGLPIEQYFNWAKMQATEKRVVITGNLLKASATLPTARIITFSDQDGKVRLGLYAPRDVTLENLIENAPAHLDSYRSVIEYLDKGGVVQTVDGSLLLRKSPSKGTYEMATPSSKMTGGKYYLDQNLETAAGGEFTKYKSSFVLRDIADHNLSGIVRYLQRDKGVRLLSSNKHLEAREMLGLAGIKPAKDIVGDVIDVTEKSVKSDTKPIQEVKPKVNRDNDIETRKDLDGIGQKFVMPNLGKKVDHGFTFSEAAIQFSTGDMIAAADDIKSGYQELYQGHLGRLLDEGFSLSEAQSGAQFAAGNDFYDSRSKALMDTHGSQASELALHEMHALKGHYFGSEHVAYSAGLQAEIRIPGTVLKDAAHRVVKYIDTYNHLPIELAFAGTGQITAGTDLYSFLDKAVKGDIDPAKLHKIAAIRLNGFYEKTGGFFNADASVERAITDILADMPSDDRRRLSSDFAAVGIASGALRELVDATTMLADPNINTEVALEAAKKAVTIAGSPEMTAQERYDHRMDVLYAQLVQEMAAPLDIDGRRKFSGGDIVSLSGSKLPEGSLRMPDRHQQFLIQIVAHFANRADEFLNQLPQGKTYEDTRRKVAEVIYSQLEDKYLRIRSNELMTATPDLTQERADSISKNEFQEWSNHALQGFIDGKAQFSTMTILGNPNDLPPHRAYDHFMKVAQDIEEDMLAKGWRLDVVAIKMSKQAWAFPGFVSDAAPGYTILPTPSFGAGGLNPDLNLTRFMIGVERTGQPLMFDSRFFTANGATRFAEQVSEILGDGNQLDPDKLTRSERMALVEPLEKALDKDWEEWHQHSVETFNRDALEKDGFDTKTTYWMPVDNGLKPELGRTSENTVLFSNRDTAIEYAQRPVFPVFLREKRVVDLTSVSMPQEANNRLKQWFEDNKYSLEIGLHCKLYDHLSYNIDDEDLLEEQIQSEIEAFTYESFKEAVSRGDWGAAGDYEGDMVSSIIACLTEDYINEEGDMVEGYDTIIFGSEFYADDDSGRELYIRHASNVNFDWPQVEGVIEHNQKEADLAEEQRKAWEAKRSEEQRKQAYEERDKAIAAFDLGSLKDQGFQTGKLWYVRSELAGFDDFSDKDHALTLYESKVDAKDSAYNYQLNPVYVRHGKRADLTNPDSKLKDVLTSLLDQKIPQRYGYTHLDGLIEGLKAGKWSANGTAVTALKDNLFSMLAIAGYDSVIMKTEGGKQMHLFEAGDATLAWDAHFRKDKRRKMSDLASGPALEAAQEQAKLAGPVLMIGYAGDVDDTNQRVQPGAILSKASEARAIVGNGPIILFQDIDGTARVFDADAREASKILPELNYIETAEGLASIHIEADDVEDVAVRLKDGTTNGAAVVKLAANGELVITSYVGERVQEKEYSAEEVYVAAVEDNKAVRLSQWEEKSSAEKYAQASLAGRKSEVLLLKGEGILEIFGDAAIATSNLLPQFKENLTGEAGEAYSWIIDSPQNQEDLARELAQNAKRLVIVDKLDRASWKVWSADFSHARTNEDMYEVKELLNDYIQSKSPETSLAGVPESMGLSGSDQVAFLRFEGQEHYRLYGTAIEKAKRADHESKLGDITKETWIDEEHDCSKINANDAASLANRLAILGLKSYMVTLNMEGEASVKEVTADLKVTQEDDKSKDGTSSDLIDELNSKLLEVNSIINREKEEKLWRSAKLASPGKLSVIKEGNSYFSFADDAVKLSSIANNHELISLPLSGRDVKYIAFSDAEWVNLQTILLERGVTFQVQDMNSPEQVKSETLPAKRSVETTRTMNVEGSQAPVKLQSMISYENRAKARLANAPYVNDNASLQVQMDEAISGLARQGVNLKSETVVKFLDERKLLNRSFYQAMSKESGGVYPTNHGYIIYQDPAGKGWAYDSMERFCEAISPDGSMEGSYPIGVADLLNYYSGNTLRTLDTSFANDVADIVRFMRSEARKINPTVDINFVDRLFGQGTMLMAGGMETSDRQPVLGLYMGNSGNIIASTDISLGDPVETGYHELWHSISPLLNARERRAIASAFPAEGKLSSEERAAEAFAIYAKEHFSKNHVNERTDARTVRARSAVLPGLDGNPKKEYFDSPIHEVVTLSTRGAKKLAGKVIEIPGKAIGGAKTAGVTLSKPISDIFAGVGDFAERMNNFATLKGFQTYEDIFKRIGKGHVGARARVYDAAMPISVHEAVRLSKAAGFDHLASTLNQLGGRLRPNRTLTGEGFYQVLRRQMTDRAIVNFLLDPEKGGYHGIRDTALATNLIQTRDFIISEEIEAQSQTTPHDIGSSKATTEPSKVANSMSRPSYGNARYSTGTNVPQIIIKGTHVALDEAEEILNNLSQEKQSLKVQEQRAIKPSRRAMVRKNIRNIENSEKEILEQLSAYNKKDNMSRIDAEKVTNLLNDKFNLDPAAKVTENMTTDAQKNEKASAVFAHVSETERGKSSNAVSTSSGELKMAASKSNSVQFNGATPLYITIDDYRNVRGDAESWPTVNHQDRKDFKYDGNSALWYIWPSHPMYDKMTALYGPDNDEAKSKWSSGQLKIHQKEQSIVPDEYRAFIYPGIENHAEILRAGAFYDASSAISDHALPGMWYVDSRTSSSGTLVEKFGTETAKADYITLMEAKADKRNRLFEYAAKIQEHSHDINKPDFETTSKAALGIGVGALAVGATSAAAADVTTEELEQKAQEVADNLVSQTVDLQIALDAYAQKAMLLGQKGAEQARNTVDEMITDLTVFREKVSQELAASFEAGKIEAKEFYETLSVEGEKLWDDVLSSDFVKTNIANTQSFDWLNVQSYQDWMVSVLPDGFTLQGVQEAFAGMPYPDMSLSSEVDVDLGYINRLTNEAGQAVSNLGDEANTVISAFRQEHPTFNEAINSGALEEGLVAGIAVAGATAVMHASDRSARRKEWLETAKETPWFLTPQQFGQVGSKLVDFEREKTTSGETISLYDKSTGEKVYSLDHEGPQKLSAREILTAYHGLLVEQALQNGQRLEPRVINGIAKEEIRPRQDDTPRVPSKLARALTIVTASAGVGLATAGPVGALTAGAASGAFQIFVNNPAVNKVSEKIVATSASLSKKLMEPSIPKVQIATPKGDIEKALMAHKVKSVEDGLNKMPASKIELAAYKTEAAEKVSSNTAEKEALASGSKLLNQVLAAKLGPQSSHARESMKIRSSDLGR